MTIIKSVLLIKNPFYSTVKIFDDCILYTQLEDLNRDKPSTFSSYYNIHLSNRSNYVEIGLENWKTICVIFCKRNCDKELGSLPSTSATKDNEDILRWIRSISNTIHDAKGRDPKLIPRWGCRAERGPLRQQQQR